MQNTSNAELVTAASNNGAMRSAVTLLGLMSCWLMCSCGSKEIVNPTSVAQDPVVGHWKATTEGAIAEVPPGPDAERIRESMRHPTLDLKADHSFELRIGYPTRGTWAKNGSILELRATEISGIKVTTSPPMNVTLEPGGQTITLTGDPSNPFKQGDLAMSFTK